MLTPVDRVEIQIVVDNMIDGFLTDGPEVRRPTWDLPQPWGQRPNLIAEHGFCARVQVWRDDETATILYDAGVTTFAAVQNMDFLGLDPATLDAVALSHGHIDHTQGLPAILERRGGAPIDLHLHPDAFLERRLVMPDGTIFLTPAPDRARLAALGARIVESRGPSLLAGGMVLLTGQIPRVTPFERGLPVHQSRIDGQWTPDPLVPDDQALIVHVRGKGLVVMTGCGHSGAINTLLHARALTGVGCLHACLGGLHLTGPLFEPIIPDTITALKGFAPRRLMPCHCTGWKATHAIADAMPEAFVISSVGTSLVIEAEGVSP
jgi:7,8-dihydropterin-6-yl-methyl-4-(beta-D-ribofuranosyl)aminobenzene 5'-phosphate synthase